MQTNTHICMSGVSNSNKNMLIVGMAVIGALALLTGTTVTIPAAFAYGEPDERSGSLYLRGIGDPNERILVH